MKKPHRFFVKDLDNSLENLASWITDMDIKLRDHKLVPLPEGIFDELDSLNTDFGSGTMALAHYNIFSYDNPEIGILKKSLTELLKDACEYYEIDYNSYTWGLHGWFNRNDKTQMSNISPIDNPDNFHEHLDGIGAPNFHGYYAVNAEPSVTVYKIDKDPNNIVVNVNRNNRAILSEVGHPHGMGNWNGDEPRITVAYDITPITDRDLETDRSYWTILSRSE